MHKFYILYQYQCVYMIPKINKKYEDKDIISDKTYEVIEINGKRISKIKKKY